MNEKELPSSSFHKNEGSASGVKSGRGEALDATNEFAEAASKDDLGRCEGKTGEESRYKGGGSMKVAPSDIGVAQTD